MTHHCFFCLYSLLCFFFFHFIDWMMNGISVFAIKMFKICFLYVLFFLAKCCVLIPHVLCLLVLTSLEKPQIQTIPDRTVTEGDTATLQFQVTNETRPIIQVTKSSESGSSLLPRKQCHCVIRYHIFNDFGEQFRNYYKWYCFLSNKPIQWWLFGSIATEIFALRNLTEYTNGNFIKSCHMSIYRVIHCSDTGNSSSNLWLVNLFYLIHSLQYLLQILHRLITLSLWKNCDEIRFEQVFISLHVQWLKKAVEAYYYPPTAFGLGGQIFTALRSGQLKEGPGNVYSSPLVFKSVSEADEGLYVCLAANRFGFSRQFANVYVSTTPTP